MGIGSGLGAQIGFGVESNYGEFATPTRFYEFNNESLAPSVVNVSSRGLGRGRFQRTGRNKSVVTGAAGAIEFDLMTKGFGLLLKACLGGYANTVVTGSERKALITPDAAGLAGQFLTCQVGKPSIDGTVNPFSFLGGKVTSWELKNTVDDKVVLVVNPDFKGLTTEEALASPSYPAGAEIFSFSEYSATLSGDPIFIKGFSIKGDNGLATSRRGLGNDKLEPLAAAEAMITGQLDFEFESLVRLGQWIAGEEVDDLIITFTTPTTLSGGGPALFKATIPWLFFTGSAPTVGGPDIVQEPMQFKGLDDGTNPVITLEQRTLDTAA